MSEKKIDFLQQNNEQENNQPDSQDVVKKEQDSNATTGKSKKPSKIGNLFKSRKFKRGWMAVALTVIFIAVVVGLNIVSTMLTDRFTWLSKDFTANSVYELTSQSVEYLSKIDKDIDIYVLESETSFESHGEYYVQSNKLLHQFDQNSSKVSLEYVDLAKNPTFTASYPDIDWQNSSYLLLIVCGDDYRGIKADDIFEYDQEQLAYYGTYVAESQKLEQSVLTAILNITTEEKIGVTVLSGQGEQDCSAFTDLLENNAYSVEEVSLLNGEISKDSQFLIIYAPSQDIDKDAFDTISDWLYNDGNYGRSLIYCPESESNTDKPNIDALLEEWGMSVSKSYAFETDSQYMTNSQMPYLISIYDYNEQDFSSKLREPNIPVVLMYTMPIEILDSSSVTSLLTTSDSAVEMPLDASSDWDYNDEEPQKLCGAAISTKSDADEKNSSNVIVIGSYPALMSSALSATSFNNSAYFINIFNTIAERDEIGVTIEGKDLDDAQLGITSTFTASMLSTLFEFIVPIAVVAIGVIIWIRRRNR